jgi:hypothetical protein
MLFLAWKVLFIVKWKCFYLVIKTMCHFLNEFTEWCIQSLNKRITQFRYSHNGLFDLFQLNSFTIIQLIDISFFNLKDVSNHPQVFSSRRWRNTSQTHLNWLLDNIIRKWGQWKKMKSTKRKQHLMQYLTLFNKRHFLEDSNINLTLA